MVEEEEVEGEEGRNAPWRSTALHCIKNPCTKMTQGTHESARVISNLHEEYSQINLYKWFR